MTDTPTTSETTSTTASPPACKACPWRTANQGKRHPDGWYTKDNLRRLWTGLRNGEDMTCHPTDPNNPVSPAATQQGYRAAPDHSEPRECIGSLVLRHREAVLLDREYGNDIRAYRADRRRGLTREGIAALVVRATFGGTFLGGPPMARPDLNDPDIGYPPLGEWQPINPDRTHPPQEQTR